MRRDTHSVSGFLGTALLVLATICDASSAASEPLDHWRWTTPTPGMASINGLAYGQNRFVAVGGHGTAMVSQDGENWTSSFASTRADLRDVVFAQGKFVAVGDLGTVVVSPDGLSWSQPLPETTRHLTSIEHGNGQFLAVGEAGTILTSSNGTDWVVHSTELLQEDERFTDLAAGNGLFLAISGTQWGTELWGRRLLISSNGIDWAEGNFPGQYTPHDVEFGEGRFVIGSEDQNVYSTADGTTWAIEGLGPKFGPGIAAYLTDGTKSVAFLGTAGSGFSVRESPTAPWRFTFRSFKRDVRSAAYGGGIWITAGGQLGQSDSGIFRSTDATTWKQIVQSPRPLLRSLLALNGTYFGVPLAQNSWIDLPPNAPSTLATSSNGLEWTSFAWPPASSPIAGTFFQGSYFIAVENGSVWKSVNGTNWTEVLFGGAASTIAASEALLVIGTADGAIARSTDGQSWTTATMASGEPIRSITYGSGRFLASTALGQLWLSLDATNWAQVPTIGLDSARSLAFCAGKFASHHDSELHFSTDGTNWSPSALNLGTELKIAVSSDRFVVAANHPDYGDGGNSRSGHHQIFSSTNGVGWTEHQGVREGLVREIVAQSPGLLMSIWPAGMLLSDPLVPTPPVVVIRQNSIAAGIGEGIGLQAEVLGTHPVELQWLASGTNIHGATNRFLQIAPLAIPLSGTFSLVASNHLGAVQSSGIKVVTGARPVLTMGPGSSPRLRVSGTPERIYRIDRAQTQSRSNLWEPVFSVTLSETGDAESNIEPGGAPQGFFRAVLVPE